HRSFGRTSAGPPYLVAAAIVHRKMVPVPEGSLLFEVSASDSAPGSALSAGGWALPRGNHWEVLQPVARSLCSRTGGGAHGAAIREEGRGHRIGHGGPGLGEGATTVRLRPDHREPRRQGGRGLGRQSRDLRGG